MEYQSARLDLAVQCFDRAEGSSEVVVSNQGMWCELLGGHMPVTKNTKYLTMLSIPDEDLDDPSPLFALARITCRIRVIHNLLFAAIDMIENDFFEVAVERLDEAIDLIDGEPLLAFFHFAKGMCLKQMSSHELALCSFSTAIELDPMYGEAYLQRAEVWDNLGKPQESRMDRLMASAAKNHE